MSRFNTNATGIKTENLAGGEAYIQSPKMELVSLLLTSFVADKHYESADSQLKRLASLVASSTDKKFVAKAAIYARNEFGMRSITHALAGELTKQVKGEEWVKNAVDKIVRRADDMTEILAYVGNPVPNSLKKGLSLAVHKFDRYQLAKYRGEGKSVKMVDLFNIVHPIPRSEEEVKLFADLMAGNLKSSTTESKMTEVGKKATTQEEKEILKANVWEEQLNSGKMPYFNLLRNLRNIEEQAPDMVDKACELLVDKKAILNSLVLPFRYLTAIQEVSDRRVISALNKAMDISLANVPIFDGKTLVVLDTSGSMSGRPIQIGALFAAALYKSNNADFMTFDYTARYITPNPDDTLTSIAGAIRTPGGSTDFTAPFIKADKKYDRIIILSDMQGWVGYHSPVADFNNYKKKFEASPHVYSFDLNGYGTMQFPENQVYCIAGFSEKIFDVMKLLEEDKNALIKKIEDYVAL
jgi:hypothetical protein